MPLECHPHLPFRTTETMHEKLGGIRTHEHNVYSAQVLSVDNQDPTITRRKDIVYKELKLDREELPEGISFTAYARELKKLYTIITTYYPEVVPTEYIIAKNHSDNDCIMAVQSLLPTPNAYELQEKSPDMLNELESKTKDFCIRWQHVTADPRWKDLPDFIADQSKYSDINLNNFTRNTDGSYAIFDW